MFYKIFLQYFRFKIVRFLLAAALAKKGGKLSSLKSMSIVSFLLELFVSRLLKTKKERFR